MASPLELTDFTVKDLEFHWEGGSSEVGEPRRDFEVTYKIGLHNENKSKYRVELSVDDQVRYEDGVGVYVLRTTAWGFFVFPPDTPRERYDYHIRVNGLTILYGALRGALASLSGLFPPNERYILPTINMIEVIKKVEGKDASSPAAIASPPEIAPP